MPESLGDLRKSKKAQGNATQKCRKSVRFGDTTTCPDNGQATGETELGAKMEGMPPQTPLSPMPSVKNDQVASNTGAKKDPKSFTQSVFDTVVFKVLQMAKIPEGYSLWAPWGHGEAEMQENRVDQSAPKSRPSQRSTNAYGPLTASSHRDLRDVADRTENGTALCGNPSIKDEGFMADNQLGRDRYCFYPLKECTEVQTHSDALDRRYYAFARVISGFIPKHLLITSHPPLLNRACSLPVRAPMALSHFTSDNIEALAAAVRAIGQRSAQAESRFLRSLGRPTAPMRLAAFQEGCATQDERNTVFVTQSIVYVLSNIKPLLKSFRTFSPTSVLSKPLVAASFREVECGFRQLMELDSYPSNVLSSLWICLGKIERSLCAQSGNRQRCSSGEISNTNDAEDQPDDALELSDADFVHVVHIVLASLVALVPVRCPEEWSAFTRLRMLGRTMPSAGRLPKSADLRDRVLGLMDVFEDDMALKLLKRLLKVTMIRCTRNPEHQSTPMDVLDAREDVVDIWIGERLSELIKWVSCSTVRRKGVAQPNKVPSFYIIVEWLRTIMIKEWDGKSSITKGGPAWGAAEFLSRLCLYSPRIARDLSNDFTDRDAVRREICKECFANFFLVDRLDVVKMPAEWVTLPEEQDSVHLLSYPFLFSSPTLVNYFRAINHAAMSKAYERSLLSGRLLSLMTWTDRETGLGAIRHRDQLNEDLSHFFVLEVSRENILTDAFNQLWRRHRREVLKPLKVRIGAQEGEEGVDHGGVQQEFFRLAIGEAFKPEYGNLLLFIRFRTQLTSVH